jgi:general secretion pathway protein E
MKRDAADLSAGQADALLGSLPFYAAQSRASAQARQPMATLVAQALQVPVQTVLQRCAQAVDLPCWTSEQLHALTPEFQSVALHEAERRAVFVGWLEDASQDGNTLWVVIDDPFDRDRLDWIEQRIERRFSYAVASAEDIRAALKRHEAPVRAVDGALLAQADGDAARGDGVPLEELTLGGIASEASPVIRLVNSVIFDALKAQASDIHLVSDPQGMAIQLRVDGVLDASGRIDSRETAEQVVSRIKVLSELDIAERRVPQDGRFQVRADGRDIDLRVSVMPAVHGEDAVIRVLDRQRLSNDMQGLRFEALGFDEYTLVQLRALSRLPYGLLLVTGPTGSGKTTTLYAALSEINDGLEKIVTIEDPVEYQLPGVVQIAVNEKRGLTFSRGLRSVLRHDPDKIMVGEIRDAETGQIAVQAALTGHLVFTTVHANSVFDVIGRMLHIGVDPYNLVSALNGVVAQRLVRMNCTHCAQPVQVDLTGRSPQERAQLEGAVLQAGRGCGHCRGTGYRGRRAVAEVLILDDTLRDAIAQRQSIAAIKAGARARNMRSLRSNALDLVAQGLTTLTELDRVTFADASPVHHEAGTA